MSNSSSIRLLHRPADLDRLSKSPYILSFPQQIKLCVDRGFQRLRGDATITISRLGANGVLAVVVGTMFIHLQENTAALTSRSILIFLAILLNAFASALEVRLQIRSIILQKLIFL